MEDFEDIPVYESPQKEDSVEEEVPESPEPKKSQVFQ